MTRYTFVLIITILTGPQLFGQFSLISTSPETNSSDIPVNQVVLLQFNDVVNTHTTFSDFSVVSNFRGKISCTFSTAGNLLTLTPSAALLNGETITVALFTTLKSASNIFLAAAVHIRFVVESKPSPRNPPTFLSSDIVSSGGINTMIGSADMDRDNDLDIVAFLGPDIVWLENNGAEEFVKHTVKTGISFPECLKAFDIDQDGDMDLLASGHAGLMILINDGNQNFNLAATINGYSIASFDLADFDADGRVDIVYSSVENISGTYVPGTYILYNQGSSVFNKVKIGSSTFYQFLCADLDNDNDWDIVHHDDTGIHYFLNSGGVFTSHTVFSDDNTVYEDVQIADINNDRYPDIVFLRYRHSTFSLEVLVNDDLLNFTRHKIEVNHIIELSSIADYDGDDDPDLMIMDGNYTYSVLENSGSWSFTKKAVAQPLSGTYYPSNSVSADFDRDGDLDLLVSPNSMVKLYKNMVYPVEYAIVPGVKVISEADSDWGDYDHDGDLDLLTTGYYEGHGFTVVYENQDGIMVERDFNISALWLGSCDWGDYDNDGDLDILLTGASSLETDDRSPQTFVYTNTGDGFALLASSSVQLPKIWYGEARWADFNNDGSLDIVFNGAYYAGIYQGDGSGNFVKKIDFPFAASWANLDTGDFDNDGDLDVAVSGYTGGAVLGYSAMTVIGNFHQSQAILLPCSEEIYRGLIWTMTVIWT